VNALPTRSLILAAALGTTSALVPAQTPPSTQAPAPPPKPTPPPFTLQVEINVVSVTAVIFDKAGHFVKGLGPADVELSEDGVRQEITYFQEAAGEGDDRIPLTVELVLDTSGSMVPHMPFLKEAAISFVNKLEEVDSALVVSFNETVKGSAEFTGDTDRLESFVNGLQAWGGTSLYDATHYALGRIKDQPGRKAIVLFTDGDDTTSSMSEQSVLDYSKAVEATIYGIGFRGQGGSLFGGGPSRGYLKHLATETGGEVFFPDKVGELNKVFNAIANELKNHYLLSYSPKRLPDGSYRVINLKLMSAKAKDLQVRVRKGYFAVKRRPTTRPK
jgi:Ca-activated chloride channel homolog